MIYPLLFKPIYKEVVWGGRKLEKNYNRMLPMEKKIGESWEIACREGSVSVIDNGIFMGRTLQDLIEEYPTEILGSIHVDKEVKFPLLIKIIDANDNLSVQVHPDGKIGKTEAWYVLSAEKDSKIVYGLKNGVDRESFIKAMNENKIEAVINEVEVKAGDKFYIPSGMIHSLGKGITVLEVQQNSDTTYRLYDWNRLGLDGKTRKLHKEEALSVIDFGQNSDSALINNMAQDTKGNSNQLVSCSFFTMEELLIESIHKSRLNGRNFEILISIDGNFEIVYGDGEVLHIDEMQTVMLPAMLGDYSIVGRCKILKAY